MVTIDPCKMMRDALIELAATEDRAAMGTTSSWWRAEIERIIGEYDSFQQFLEHGRDEMMPKMAESLFSMTILPDEEHMADPKFCMELGAAIMFDKPIVALAEPGMKIPNQLRRIAHDIVEIDLDDPSSRERTTEVIQGLLEQLAEDGVIGRDEGIVSDD